MSFNYDQLCHHFHIHNNESQNCDINNAKIECIQSQIEVNVNNNNIESINKTETLLKDDNSLNNDCDDHTIDSNDVQMNSNTNGLNSLKHNFDEVSRDSSDNNVSKRLKLNCFQICDHLISDPLNSELSSFQLKPDIVLKSFSTNVNSFKEQTEDNNVNNSCDNQLINDNKICDTTIENESKPKKKRKHVKWRQNIVNANFNEDSLSNMYLSETYYYYGLGIVTGEQGSVFGGNRFNGFSRHLFSDQTGITVELCKPFIINHILIELEDKTDKKSPLFSYKVWIAIDECMTDWHLIKDYDAVQCFGQQSIHFYPRIVQYIRIVGSHGIYCGKNRESDARYFTVLSFDCIFDDSYI